MNTTPERVVHCEDAVAWLQNCAVLGGCSLVASLPDVSEFPLLTLDQWQEWFLSTATLILSRTAEDGIAVFYQSDVKYEGTWISKAYLCQKAAERAGHSLLWHKIVCRTAPGMITFKRAAYSHVLCFSKGVRLDTANSTPDVLPEMGEKTWERGMGFAPALMIGRFIAKHTTSNSVVHPFCGQGSMLAVANALGLNAIGIERSRKCAELARTLQVDIKAKKWLNVPVAMKEFEPEEESDELIF